jgi:hypothetical protein
MAYSVDVVCGFVLRKMGMTMFGGDVGGALGESNIGIIFLVWKEQQLGVIQCELHQYWYMALRKTTP